MITGKTHSYGFKLTFLGDLGHCGKSFIDKSSRKKLTKELTGVKIYYKYPKPIADEFVSGYKLVSHEVIVNCKEKIIAIGSSYYFKGQNLDSEIIKMFDDTRGINGDTGRNFRFYYDLVFKESNEFYFGGDIIKYACNKNRV